MENEKKTMKIPEKPAKFDLLEVDLDLVDDSSLDQIFGYFSRLHQEFSDHPELEGFFGEIRGGLDAERVLRMAGVRKSRMVLDLSPFMETMNLAELVTVQNIAGRMAFTRQGSQALGLAMLRMFGVTIENLMILDRA